MDKVRKKKKKGGGCRQRMRQRKSELVKSVLANYLVINFWPSLPYKGNNSEDNKTGVVF